MIRIKQEVGVELIDDLVEYVDYIEAYSEQAVEQAYAEIRAPLLDELGYVPPRRDYPQDYPIVWTSEAQRRYVFAVVLKRGADGQIIPYQRTGRMSSAWVVEREGATLIIYNPIEQARFVYGSLAQNVDAAQRFQQRWHIKTGWFPATVTVKYWQDVFFDEYKNAIDAQLDSVGTKQRRRAYTSPRSDYKRKRS